MLNIQILGAADETGQIFCDRKKGFLTVKGLATEKGPTQRHRSTLSRGAKIVCPKKTKFLNFTSVFT